MKFALWFTVASKPDILKILGTVSMARMLKLLGWSVEMRIADDKRASKKKVASVSSMVVMRNSLFSLLLLLFTPISCLRARDLYSPTPVIMLNTKIIKVQSTLAIKIATTDKLLQKFILSRVGNPEQDFLPPSPTTDTSWQKYWKIGITREMTTNTGSHTLLFLYRFQTLTFKGKVTQQNLSTVATDINKPVKRAPAVVQ